MQTQELKKLKQILYYIKLIGLAKEALKNRLNDEKNYVHEDDYNTFVISAFMLVKENLVKKDASNDTLYFDYTEKYIPYILELASKINPNDYIKNNTAVIIENAQTPANNLEDAIWIVNKIRDSLAHGVYEIKGDKIIIDNDHTDELIPYKLTCTLDIDDLAQFVLSAITETKIDKNQIFKYISPLLTRKANNKPLRMATRGYSTHILHETKKKPRNYHDNDRIYNSIKSENDSYKVVFEDYNQLRKRMHKNPKLYRYLEYSIATADRIIDNANEEETRITKTTDIISSITTYFGASNINDVIDYIYLYNYMTLVFTLNSEDKVDLPNLDLTNIDFTIDDADYKNIKDSLSLTVNNGTQKIKDAQETYENNKDRVPYHIVTNIIDSLELKITDKVNTISNIIIRLIRNGLEHANFKEEDSKIKISDKQNQNSTSEKATFNGTVYDFYHLTSYVESQKLKPNVELLNLAILKNYITQTEYDEFVDAIPSLENKIKVK